METEAPMEEVNLEEFDLNEFELNENEEDLEEAIARVQKELEEEEAKKTEKPKVVRKRRTVKAKADDTDINSYILPNKEIHRFFQGREKAPSQFVYTPEGNLEIKGVKDVPDTVIQMNRKFVPLKGEQLEEILVARQKRLEELEQEYETAFSYLRIMQEAYQTGDATAEEVVDANIEVENASKKISQAAYPERWVSVIHKGIETRMLLMTTEPYEKRKFRYAVNMFKHHEISRKQAWGTYKEGIVEETVMEGGSIQIRFITDIEDPKTGHFHPFTIRAFTFNETEYASPYQAYHAERFKELEKEDLRKQILGTRSGRTMHSIAIQEKTLPKMPQKLWEDILFQFFHQNKDLAKELDSTGTERFHVMDKQIPSEYAQALNAVRTKLRELGDKEVDHQEAKEKAITEDEQKKAKVGAIIQNFRKRG